MEKDKDEVRQRILAAAKELFVQQGYKKTTIRQIVEKSGVLTGSIYYFFKNKEDIFQSLVMELLRQCTDLIAAHFRQESPAMNQLVRETYYEGYTTPLTFEKITDHLADMTGRIFGDSLGLSKEDIFLRSLLIKGAMRGYIVQFDFSQPMDSQKYAALVLDTALQLLGISAAESHDVLAQLEQRLPEIEAIADEMIHRR